MLTPHVHHARQKFQIERPALITSERGALLHCYGQPWNVFVLVDGEYHLAKQLEAEPSSTQLTSIVTAELMRRRKRDRTQNDGLDVQIRRLFGF